MFVERKCCACGKLFNTKLDKDGYYLQPQCYDCRSVIEKRSTELTKTNNAFVKKKCYICGRSFDMSLHEDDQDSPPQCCECRFANKEPTKMTKEDYEKSFGHEMGTTEENQEATVKVKILPGTVIETFEKDEGEGMRKLCGSFAAGQFILLQVTAFRFFTLDHVGEEIDITFRLGIKEIEGSKDCPVRIVNSQIIQITLKNVADDSEQKNSFL